MDMTSLYAVVLAGGSGTRFWPVSRAHLPKQFLTLEGTQSLLQATVSRIAPLIAPQRTYVVTAAPLQPQTVAQLPAVPIANILSEPMGRNTAAAIGLAAWHLQNLDPAALMVVLPADHAIADGTAFCDSVQQAAATVLQTDRLMTFGVQPTYPATGYGYIEVGAELGISEAPRAAEVTRFQEKPTAEVAAQLMASQRYLWNCGIFLWRAATIARELRTHMPALAHQLDVYMAALQAGAAPEVLQTLYQQLPSLPIDIGVLEPSSCVGVLPVTWAWSDVGSWGALRDLHPADAAGNVAVGHHIGHGTTNAVVYSPHRLVVTIGVSDVIIVQTDDVLLVCHKDQDQAVREVVQLLQQRGETTYL